MKNSCPHCNNDFDECVCDWDQIEADMGESILLSSRDSEDEELLAVCSQYGL